MWVSLRFAVKAMVFSCMFLSSEIFHCEVLCFCYIFSFCFVQFIAIFCFFDLLTVFQGKRVSVCGCRVQACCSTSRTMFYLALKEPKQKYSCFKHLAVVVEFGATAIAADVGGDFFLLQTRIYAFHTAIPLNKQCLTSVLSLCVCECVCVLYVISEL